MKIKYLKVMHNANIGDVLEVTDFEANILIKTGVAEAAEDTPNTQDQASAIVYTPIDTTGLLLNLNRTPVVDDFGELIAEQQVKSEEKPKQPRKPRNKKTAEQE